MHRFLLTIAIAVTMSANAIADTAETQADVAGVAAVEAHWSKAFQTGDAAYLQQLLTDDYISVNAKGVPRDRATIIALAQSHAAQPPPSPMHAMPEAALIIRVQGTSAIVTSDAGGQRSVDVFFYAGGRWHAWYSQHTAVGS
jgi:ketosteroid isomerase-like protein